MAFLLALLGLIVAGDVVELGPLRAAPGNVYGCNTWSGGTDASNNKQWCDKSPYCLWGSGFKCYDDPCLSINSAASVCPPSHLVEGIGGSDITITCQNLTTVAAQFTGGDCGDDQTVGSLCVQNVQTQATSSYDYCLYAQLRDGTCPASVCREYEYNRPDNKLAKHCLRNDKTGCAILSTSEECGLVPKCYWKSSSCVPDPCYILEEDIPGGGACAAYHPNGDTSITCKEFKPFKKNGGGSLATYCVNSDNSKPNLCYLGNPGTDPDSITDYGDSYPTLNISDTTGALIPPLPDCSTTSSSCDNMGTCVVVMNKKGAFAGAYCSDGEHGAANILRIPTLFVVLLVALFSIFN